MYSSSDPGGLREVTDITVTLLSAIAFSPELFLNAASAQCDLYGEGEADRNGTRGIENSAIRIKPVATRELLHSAALGLSQLLKGLQLTPPCTPTPTELTPPTVSSEHINLLSDNPLTSNLSTASKPFSSSTSSFLSPRITTHAPASQPQILQSLPSKTGNKSFLFSPNSWLELSQITRTEISRKTNSSPNDEASDLWGPENVRENLSSLLQTVIRVIVSLPVDRTASVPTSVSSGVGGGGARSKPHGGSGHTRQANSGGDSCMSPVAEAAIELAYVAVLVGGVHVGRDAAASPQSISSFLLHCATFVSYSSRVKISKCQALLCVYAEGDSYKMDMLRVLRHKLTEVGFSGARSGATYGLDRLHVRTSDSSLRSAECAMLCLSALGQAVSFFSANESKNIPTVSSSNSSSSIRSSNSNSIPVSTNVEALQITKEFIDIAHSLISYFYEEITTGIMSTNTKSGASNDNAGSGSTTCDRLQSLVLVSLSCLQGDGM